MDRSDIVSLKDILMGIKVHLFVDNSVSLFSLLKGGSKDSSLTLLVRECFDIVSTHSLLLGARYVPSALNPADHVSRPELFETFVDLIGSSNAFNLKVCLKKKYFRRLILDLMDHVTSSLVLPVNK